MACIYIGFVDEAKYTSVTSSYLDTSGHHFSSNVQCHLMRNLTKEKKALVHEIDVRELDR